MPKLTRPVRLRPASSWGVRSSAVSDLEFMHRSQMPRPTRGKSVRLWLAACAHKERTNQICVKEEGRVDSVALALPRGVAAGAIGALELQAELLTGDAFDVEGAETAGFAYRREDLLLQVVEGTFEGDVEHEHSPVERLLLHVGDTAHGF